MLKFKKNKKHIEKVKKTTEYKIWNIFKDKIYPPKTFTEEPLLTLSDRAFLRLRMLDIPLTIRRI